MRAVILAGGFGTRLFPYTSILPKPLVPVGDKPIIEIVIRQLAHQGFDRITIAVGYHAELIMAVLGNGEKFHVQINYSIEEKPLNTIGPIRLIQNLNEPFLLMNGDLLTDLNYADLYHSHRQNGSILTVASCKKHVCLSLGVMEYDKNNQLISFQEKPTFDYDVSMGVYILEPRISNFIPENQSFGFDQLILRLLDSREPVSVYPFQGNWLDMGTQDDLNRAIEEFEANKARYLPPEAEG
ncbi:MAG: nucleotidyltransferase family protein [Candidatus Hinthialibacter sp.]